MLTTPTNDDRAEWAAEAIRHFGALTDMDTASEDEETMFGDLLADMMHWCDRNGVDFQAKLQSAEIHYEEEKRDDD